MESNITVHCGNVTPLLSSAWGNTNIKMTSTPNFDGDRFWYWYPDTNFILWFESPLIHEEIENGIPCYRTSGNVWFCPESPYERPIQGNTMPVPPIPSLPEISGNIRPSITVTTAKMENHAEHVSVLFGQVISNLK